MFSSRGKAVFYVSRRWDAVSSQTKQLWPLDLTVTEYSGGYFWDLHEPPYLIMELLLDGGLTANIDGRTYDMVPGDLLMVSKPHYAAFQTGKSGFFRKTALLLQGTLLDSVLLGFSLDKVRLLHLKQLEKIVSQWHEIGLLLEKKEPESIHLINGKLIETLSFLAEESAFDNEYPEELKRTLQRIETRLDSAVSLEELADVAGCSVSTLQRLFSRYCKTTPYRYRQKLRMQQAVQLLDHSFLSIKEIAGRIGYADQAYFSNDFKKYYHLSPGEWRKKKNLPET